MYKGTAGSSDHLLKMMESEISRCNHRIEETNRALDAKQVLTKNIAASRENLRILEGTINYLKTVRKGTIKYIDKKKEKSMTSIYHAIYSAKSVLPDTTNVQLKVERESAYLINDRGHNVNKIEGSAFRALLSTFMRRVILGNTPHIPFLLLDEPLATLSPETSVEFSPHLATMAQDCQIILVEQKTEIFNQVSADVVYNFKKSEGKTRVSRGD